MNAGTGTMPAQALSGVRVLDMGHHVAGPYCAKMFADLGASVIKLEKPDVGDASRSAGPFPDDIPHPEKSGLFLYLNHNKKSITLNLKTDTGVIIFKDLARQVDIVVENFSPRVMPGLGLDYETLKAINPGLVMTSISNFGQTGPYRDYRATDLVMQSVAGWVRARGEPDREPVMAAAGLKISEYVGGMYAAVGTLTALGWKNQTGVGQHVDVSLMEATHMMLPYPVAMKTFPRSPGWQQGRMPFSPGITECKDGYIGVNILTGLQWRDLCRMTGMEDWAENPEYVNNRTRRLRRGEVADRMRPWLMAHAGEDILAEGQSWRIPVAMVSSSEHLLRSRQYNARDYFVEVDHPATGKVVQPGAPYRLSETPWQVRAAAPRLGEHNREIYCDLLGHSKSDLVRLRQMSII